MTNITDIPKIRQKMIDIVKKVGKGHLGTSLSSLEAILAIRERMKENDIFISSKGHDALAQYAVLAESGILAWDDVETFRQPGGLPSHPTVDTPGISGNTGSLGMGLSKALGFALGRERHVYVLLGDGEMMEGQNYEAMLAIGKLGLSNITAVVDCNHFSQDGEAALSGADIRAMFNAAKWGTIHLLRQHDFYDLKDALNAVTKRPRPQAIIVETVKGKGAEFEGTWQSHAGPPRTDYSVKHPLYKELGRIIDLVLGGYPDTILCGADTLRDLNCYQLKEKYPDRVFDFGIAEQNIVSFASARALMGQVPIVATYACFLRRAFEQIYNQTTEETQVLYVGTMAGPLEEGGPGISHESLDDRSYMSNLMVTEELYPHQAHWLASWFWSALEARESAYLRLIHNNELV